MIGTSTLGVAAFTGSVSTDVMVLDALLVVLVLLTLYSGAAQAVSIGLASLFAPVLLIFAKEAAFLSAIPLDTPSYERTFLLILFALLAVLFKLMTRDILHMTAPMQAIIAGISASCLVLLAWVSTPVLADWFRFGPTITAIFDASFRFWWILVAFALFGFSRM